MIASLGVTAPYFSAGLRVAAAVAVPSLCAAAPVVVSSLGVSPVVYCNMCAYGRFPGNSRRNFHEIFEISGKRDGCTEVE